jgi:RNA polymerase sigma-70 factor (sigma-E family)
VARELPTGATPATAARGVISFEGVLPTMSLADVRASFEEFVRGRTPALLRIAYLLVGNAHDAEDIVQSALEKAATRWRRLDDPEAYLRRVLYNQSISRWRRLRARPPETLMADLPERPADADHDTRLAMAAALRRLTPRQRAVLVLRYYEDRTEVETAALLGIGRETVKSQTRIALRRLREIAPDLAEHAEVPR